MKTSRFVSLYWHIVFLVTICILLFPIIFAVGSSFKSLQEAYNNVMTIIPIQPTLENYQTFFASLPALRIAANTFVIASVVTLFKVATSFLAAYAFVFFHFRAKKSGLFHPDQHHLYPLYCHDDPQLSGHFPTRVDEQYLGRGFAAVG